jgi:hypothetical protein
MYLYEVLNYPLFEFDVIAAITDRNDLCGLNILGARGDGTNILWVKSMRRDDFAHEVCHILGLWDEYCSKEAGSNNPHCNQGKSPDAPVNYLGQDLDCDPQIGTCCDPCSGYENCCAGNIARLGTGRCVMASPSLQAEHYCQRCYTAMKNPLDLRTLSNPTGQVAIASTFSYLGSMPIGLLNLGLTEQGDLWIYNWKTAFGRIGLGNSNQQGNFRIELSSPNGELYYKRNINIFLCNQYVLYSNYANGSTMASVGLRAPLPGSIAPTDPIKVTSLILGEIMSQTTINGSPPVAAAGNDIVVECETNHSASVTLNGSESSDADGDSLRFFWSAPGIVFENPHSANLHGVFPLGTTTVTLVVFDGLYESTPDMVNVTVQDTIPPELNITCNTPILSPANHKLVEILVDVSVYDQCDPGATFILESITSSEPDEGTGDGDFPGDVQQAEFGTPDTQFLLRAERCGPGVGRAYTINYMAIDSSGNTSEKSIVIRVPHDRRFLRGDPNRDGKVNMADVIRICRALFGNDQIPCEAAADSNDDGSLDVSDAVYLALFLFSGKINALPQPYPIKGLDPTVDDLSCIR